MLKIAFALAASLLGLATLAAAQESAEDQYLAVAESGPWYLQRSSCTLAHNDDATGATAWFRITMGIEIEFADTDLRGVSQDGDTPLEIAVDGASQETLGQGISFADGRSGYHLSANHELADQLAAGRRMEVRRGAEAVLRLDLAGADRAMAAQRACYDEAAAAADAMEAEANVTNAF